MKVLYVSWLIVFFCKLGRCDLEPSTHQVFATGGVPPAGGGNDNRPDPLKQEYWNTQLKKYPGDAFRKTQVQVKDYFKKYAGTKLESVQADKKPEAIIDQELDGLEKTGTQICLYRCMDVAEAEEMKIDLKGYNPVLPCQLERKFLKGHLGHLDQAAQYCRPGQAGAPKILIEFLLKPNAHDLLFSPKMMALGTESKSTAVIAETAVQKGQGKYVIKKNSEGFVKGYLGLKSEENYFSLAMQANHAQRNDNETKRLLFKLTQYIRAIREGDDAQCLPVSVA